MSATDAFVQHRELGLGQSSIFEMLLARRSSKEIATFSQDLITRIYSRPDHSLPPYGAQLCFSVNDRCNLACHHCYYASTHNKRLSQLENNLALEDWKRVIT